MSELKAAELPIPLVLKGEFCRLEPLRPIHAKDLFEAINGQNIQKYHQYLFETPPDNEAQLARWIEAVSADPDMIYFAVINKATKKCGGRQALMRIEPNHASIEIGSILWGHGVARTAIATESFYLSAKHVFDDLGYRRFEWKCNNLNTPSKRAAIRFGFTFEGVFRQHMIIKGANRDTAWFSIIDKDWPAIRDQLERWLDPDNFDAAGLEKTPLSTPRQKLSG
ncbi:MAG: GNAT family N-acetyltransferase [Devosiaceae bacterium]|nr:GNAT family N-acetyltransferase [Devosiaceae bacterium]